LHYIYTTVHEQSIPYDIAVLATGSFPFVPPTPGIDKPGVFVYRTLDDLEAMIAYQKEHGVRKAAVIGGGLLGLEAAKAMSDLGCETHVMEYAPILMCRQVTLYTMFMNCSYSVCFVYAKLSCVRVAAVECTSALCCVSATQSATCND
jgi:NADH dehydrogenase FAD-containing subunit